MTTQKLSIAKAFTASAQVAAVFETYYNLYQLHKGCTLSEAYGMKENKQLRTEWSCRRAYANALANRKDVVTPRDRLVPTIISTSRSRFVSVVNYEVMIWNVSLNVLQITDKRGKITEYYHVDGEFVAEVPWCKTLEGRNADDLYLTQKGLKYGKIL